ncbi:MAG: hydrogenase nickel incorporation protein HypB [Thermoanaerobaculales bacterium]|jgi:hydrogenase nickel incorporation protein HypB|nr:hydrogenase nickel incorporation protein HypB [Thermoanaerobaculales bacterium]
MKQVVTVKRHALAANEEHAELLRRRFAGSGTLAVNLISSPGSGKTTLLEATLRALRGTVSCAVIEGDVATENDADRIRALGVPAHQILTGGSCHLDARQVARALDEGGIPEVDVLFIENVGNLICPTTYDLGEDFKVVVLSVTEGDDKPVKYPAIFSRAEAAVISKADLLPHVPFDLAAVQARIRSLNPTGTILVASALSGEGIGGWTDLLRTRLAAKRRAGV